VRLLASEGLTQRAIADQLGLSRGAVWRALRSDSGSPSSSHAEPRGVTDDEASGAAQANGLLLVAVIAAGIQFFLRRQSRSKDAPSASMGGWVMLPTGQVVWRYPPA
jgi:Winged helix-turn-helix DNA-binding